MLVFSQKQLEDYKRIYGENMSEAELAQQFIRSIELIASVMGVEEFDLESLNLSCVNDSLGFHDAVEALPQKKIDPNTPTEELILDAERKLDHSEKISSYKEDIVGDPTINYISGDEIVELRELRHRVIRTHIEIEGSLGLIIDAEVVNDTSTKIDLDSYLSITNKISLITYQMTFRERLMVANKLNLIDPNLLKKIEHINSVRNQFAHNDASQLISYIRDREKKENLLRTLLEISNYLDAIFHKLSDPFNKRFG
jgi:hypothetical protein